MRNVYIDTSAFFKLFVEEEASDIVEKVNNLAKEGWVQIILSDWVINESLALVDENKRKDRITEAESQGILSDIVDMIQNNANFTIYSISERVIIESRFVIQDFHIPASDAIHVYIAGLARCDCFISADKNLVDQINKTNTNLFSQIISGFNIRLENDVKSLFQYIK